MSFHTDHDGAAENPWGSDGAAENPWGSDGAGRVSVAATGSVAPAGKIAPAGPLLGARSRRRGVGAVLFWHGIGCAVAAGITALIAVVVASSPGGLNNPKDFIPGWVIPALFAVASIGLLLTSFVIAVLAMALLRPTKAGFDPKDHGLAVSCAALALSGPTIWIGLQVLMALSGA
jgi:hypothetical protein